MFFDTINTAPSPGQLLYLVFPSFSPEPAQSRGGILGNALDHNHKIGPFHRVASALGIIFRYTEPTRLQPLHIHNHTTVLGMKEFHQPSAAADEDEHVTVLYVGSHLFLDHSYKRVDPLAHVRPSRTQMVAHRFIKREHDISPDCGSTPPSASSRFPGRSVPSVRWGKPASHRAIPVLTACFQEHLFAPP